MIVFIKIITNKWTYITILLLFLIVCIFILNIKNKNLKKEIGRLENIILENKKEIILKEKLFESERKNIEMSFRDSYESIQKLDDKKLSTSIIESINSIQKDFLE